MDEAKGYAHLREKIIDQMIPLLDSDTLAADDRFSLLSQVARLRGSLDLYERAFKATDALDADRKVRALLDLLSDVDIEIQDRNSAAEASQSRTQENAHKADEANESEQPASEDYNQ